MKSKTTARTRSDPSEVYSDFGFVILCSMLYVRNAAFFFRHRRFQLRFYCVVVEFGVVDYFPFSLFLFCVVHSFFLGALCARENSILIIFVYTIGV